MRHITTFLILIFSTSIFAQNNVVKTVGVSYTTGAPTFSPGKYGSQVAIDTATGLWYEHNGTSWSAAGNRVQTISGCSAPAYTPAKYQSRLVINACTAGQGGPELYYYTGSVWLQINEGQTYTAGAGIDITGGVISATAMGGPDSTFRNFDGTYTEKRITGNINRDGGISIGTTDTTGNLTVNQNNFNKPAQYSILNGTGYRLYERVKNPSLGWQGTYGDWYEGAINNGTGQNGGASFPPGAVTDTLPNVVWRRGLNFAIFPTMYESDETNWWGSGFIGPNPTAPRNVYEKHWQMIDSANVEHRPLTGYFEKKAGGYGSLGINVSLAAFLGWNYEQNSIMTLNRNSEGLYGQANFFKDTLRTLNLSDLSKNSVLHLAAADNSFSNPNGKANFLTIGGYGSFGNRVGIGSLYTSTNNGGDLDMLLTTPQSGVNTEIVRVKGGVKRVGINNSDPLQTIDIGGTSLFRGSIRVNMVGDSAAALLKYSSSQTTPIFKVQNNAGSDLFYAHSYNSTNPSLVFGKITSVAATSANNTVFGLTTAVFGTGRSNTTLFGFNTAGASYNGYENTHIGSGAGRNTTDGYQNFLGGYLAGGALTTGYQNMFIGQRAGASCTTCPLNVAIGASALANGTTYVANTAIGTQAGQLNNGDINTFIGFGSGRTNTGSGNVFIGASSGELTASVSNKLMIDNSNTSVPLIGGDFDNNSVGINTAPGSIAASAAFEITSTTQGFLPPRMTTAQRDAISSPATALTLYCTDCTATDGSTGVMQVYNGATWKNAW